MNFTEKKLTKRYCFRGRIINTRVDNIVLPNGKPSIREVCEHPGGVGVLPIWEDGTVTLVRQFRYPFGETMLEIPAGKLDHGPEEDHYTCGVRELAEETGCTADEITYLGCIYPSPGFSTEITHLYAARGLHQGQAHLDEGEFLELVGYRSVNWSSDCKWASARCKNGCGNVLREAEGAFGRTEVNPLWQKPYWL